MPLDLRTWSLLRLWLLQWQQLRLHPGVAFTRLIEAKMAARLHLDLPKLGLIQRAPWLCRMAARQCKLLTFPSPLARPFRVPWEGLFQS